MFLRKIAYVVFIGATLIKGSSEDTLLTPSDLESEIEVTETTLRSPDNKSFNNVRVYHTLHTKDLYVEDDVVIGGSLKVNGSLVGEGNVSGPSSSTTNAVARFVDDSGSSITDSLVIIDENGNVSGINNLSAVLINADLVGTASAASFVGGQSAADVAQATVLASTATSDNIYNTLVKRDNLGTFITTMITLTGDITNPQDAATKDYVDTTATSGIVVKTPARVVSTTNTGITGLSTLDDVVLIANDRVLLTGQSTPAENGLWLAQSDAWTRPTDFATGDAAGEAYVLTTSGTVYAGSGWISTTPDAVINTDSITFVQFSSPGSVDGANVGVGIGTIYRDKTGNLINLKTLIAGSHLLITNNTDDITLTVSAVSENIPETIVLRDAFGNFSAGVITAALTGTASENVLRSGDTMTGTLTLIDGSSANPSLQFVGSSNTGLSAENPDTLVFSTNGAERMSIDSTGTVAITQFTSAGIIHNASSGALSSSLIVDADIDAAANIVDTKLATISTPGKVLNSATSATSANDPNTIVLRDGSGNFEANVITAASIVGSSTLNVLKAGDTMTGTFTVIAGSAANPSLQFVGSNNTGLSAETPNTLVFSTDSTERMSLSETGTVAIAGTLALAAGSSSEPSLQFINGSNTGISSETPDRISFDINGVERMYIDATSVTMIGGAVVFGNVMSINSTQTVSLSGTLPSVAINDGIATLVIVYTGESTITNLSLPSSPIEGQLVTIKAIRLTNGNLTITNYNPAFTPAVEAITQLSPNANLASSQGGASVTYIWLTTASGVPSNGWYRYGRG